VPPAAPAPSIWAPRAAAIAPLPRLRCDPERSRRRCHPLAWSFATPRPSPSSGVNMRWSRSRWTRRTGS
jgi:hypothetical protein